MRKIISTCNILNFGLVILLITLYLFSQYIQVPTFGQVFGRMHPLLLHLPIGMFIIYFLTDILTKNEEYVIYDDLLLQLTLLTGLLSAITGFILASENDGNTSSSLFWHKNGGTIFLVGLYIFSYIRKKLTPFLKSGSLIILFILLIITGHHGAVMTHGENFLKFGSLTNDNTTLDPEKSIYSNVIQPVLDAKCFTCHNTKKSNGNLIMTDSLSLMKGGKTGAALIAGNAEKSLMFQRILLPDNDEKHMPPLGKNQLTPHEAKLIELWINGGAHYNKKLNDIRSDTFFYQFLEPFYNQKFTRIYTFQAASPSTIQKLNNAYRKVYPLYANSPALAVTYLLASRYSSESLQELKPISKQITELNLNNMPVSDQDLEIISNMENLENLILNGSKISNQGIKKLVDNKNLRQLALSNTAVNRDIAMIIPKFTKLKKIFLTHTNISPEEISKIKSSNPSVEVFYDHYSNMITQLPPPIVDDTESILDRGSSIILKHPIKGVNIKYTVDETDPDSINSLTYEKPIPVKEYLKVKTKAFKESWISSDTKIALFLSKGLKPAEGKLLTNPNEKYNGGGFDVLIDGKSGPLDNFININWLGFKDQHFEALFSFPESQKVSTLIIKYGLSISKFAFPPTEIKIFGGQSPDQMKLIKSVKLPTYTEDNKESIKNDIIPITLDGATYKHYKVFVQNLKVIPPWHQGKGTPAWFFIDEVFFYE